MPFILVGPAHNLEYLRSYGFQTFSNWWDEGYDAIPDPVDRLSAIGNLLTHISNQSLDDLSVMLTDMAPVLKHNYELFNSQEFLDTAWAELTTNLQASVSDFEPIDYSTLGLHLQDHRQYFFS
jgi:hypothetical protein